MKRDDVIMDIVSLLALGATQTALLLSCQGIISHTKKKKDKVEYDYDKGFNNSKVESLELYKVNKMRNRSLTEPLAEIVRPKSLDEIIGQNDGIKALKAALCGKNPQHIIIYGPAGVGKTCAARLVLEQAKKEDESPFDENSAFVEVDCANVRYDERSIADPLIGSVHDPIYQGAGSWGSMCIPRPQIGAVSRAHCGVLFLDEIGEMHRAQMNKLLKVLEDRKVILESSYYSKDNRNIPQYIHDIFEYGIPADFRLIGATTRKREEIPQALRSRCVEIFFEPLKTEDIIKIANNAAVKAGYVIKDDALMACAEFSDSGRNAVNIIQFSSAFAKQEKRNEIISDDVLLASKICRYERKIFKGFKNDSKIGRAYAVGLNDRGGTLLEIECSAQKNKYGNGTVYIGSIAQSEELKSDNGGYLRQSVVKSSIENAVYAVLKLLGEDMKSYDVRFNVPGAMMIDGPSASLAFAMAFVSEVINKEIKGKYVFTGETGLAGDVSAVGGIREKIELCKFCGAEKIFVPSENEVDKYDDNVVIPVKSISDAVKLVFADNQP